MYHIAVDIGGTFTDCAVLDAEGRIAAIAKSFSTPPERTRPFVSRHARAACQTSFAGMSVLTWA